MNNQEKIITMRVDITNKDKVLEDVAGFIEDKRSAYICVSNVHMCMETFDSLHFMNIVNNADLVIPDGRPIYWAQRLLRNSNAEHVRGQDIMNALCEMSAKSNINIGLYGGSSDALLENVVRNLTRTFKGLNITYTYSPPFRPLTKTEDEEVVNKINTASVDVLFVGIGCPKQEVWMAEHKGRIDCVMLGVGAAFDFIAGSKKHAPKWMQKFGLEWFFRLCCEPKRLWKRYLKQNPRFIFYFFKQLLNNS